MATDHRQDEIRAGWHVRIHRRAAGDQDPHAIYCVVRELDIGRAEAAAKVNFRVSDDRLVQVWKPAFEGEIVRRQMAPGDVQRVV